MSSVIDSRTRKEWFEGRRFDISTWKLGKAGFHDDDQDDGAGDDDDCADYDCRYDVYADDGDEDNHNSSYYLNGDGDDASLIESIVRQRSPSASPSSRGDERPHQNKKLCLSKQSTGEV